MSQPSRSGSFGGLALFFLLAGCSSEPTPFGTSAGTPTPGSAGSAALLGGAAGALASTGGASASAGHSSTGGGTQAGTPGGGGGTAGLATGGAGASGAPGGGAASGGAAPAESGAGGRSSSSGGAAAGNGASGGAGAGRGGSSAGGAAGRASAGGAGAGGAPGGAGSGASGAAGAFGVCTGAAPANAVSVYVIGDSTASVYTSDLYPRMGWGQPLGELFASQCAVVKDKALSGRSSKSFLDEGAWAPVRDALKSGDYVFIQFAHNDEKSDDPARYTDPQTTYKQYLTTYVTDTRSKLATPLLLTPINRNNWNGASLADTHGAYPGAMRELAQSLDVDLVDLTALTKTYFERIGQTATTKLFMDLAAGQFPNYPSGNSDNTHLQETGARLIGQLAMADAYRQRLLLATYLKAIPVAP